MRTYEKTAGFTLRNTGAYFTRPRLVYVLTIGGDINNESK